MGGVAGGMSFATRYKRLHPLDEVIVFDKGPYVSFANCGLPYALSNTIDNVGKLIVATKERLELRFDIVVKPETEVISVNPKTKSIIALNKDGEQVYYYDALVLSPGAKPLIIDIEGMDKSLVFGLRNIPDLDKILAKIAEKEEKDILVVGEVLLALK